MWSQICGENAMFVHKITLKKVKTQKTKKFEIALFCQSTF